MKYNIFFIGLALLSFVLSSCEDGEDFPLTKLEGTYTGTFQRTSGTEVGEIANVTITFENNMWEGQSEKYRYPAICKGTYQIKGQIINFENQCMFTADFDWTLILDGDFEINQTTDTFTMTKVYPNEAAQIKDVYTLHLVDIEN